MSTMMGSYPVLYTGRLGESSISPKNLEIPPKQRVERYFYLIQKIKNLLI